MSDSRTVQTAAAIGRLFALMAFMAVPASAVTGDERSIDGPMAAQFVVSIAKDHPRSAAIKARIRPRGNTLSMFVVPTPSLPDGAAAFVTELRARSTDGADIPLEALGVGDWRLKRVPETVLLNYRVQFRQERFNDWPGGQDEHGYTTSQGVFVRSASLFILPGRDAPGGYDVTFELPPRWHAATAWKRTGDAEFHVDNLRTLVDYAVFLGSVAHETVDLDGFELCILMGGSLGEKKGLFIDLLRPSLAGYVDMFGGLPRSPAYLVVLNPLSFTDGSAFRNSFSQVFAGPATAEGYPAWGHIMAHELLHYWLGWALTAKQQEEWLKEGFTEYLTSVHLVRSGVLDEKYFIGRIETALGQVRRARKVRPALSLREAGRNKGQNRGLIYGGGALVALALDLEIRGATKNVRSIDDVMSAMYREFAMPGKKYTLPDVERIAGEVARVDLDTLFENCVRGNGDVDISGYLARIGLRVERNADRPHISDVSEPTLAQREQRRALFSPRAKD